VGVRCFEFCDLRRYFSKRTGKLIEEEEQLYAAVMIGWNRFKATIDTGETASLVSEELTEDAAE